MLQCKGINKISELKNGFTHSWLEPNFILSSLKSFSFSGICKCLSGVKMRGYGLEIIFTTLISLPFIGESTVNTMVNKSIRYFSQARKDVFYRLKNNADVCWRLILWMFANKFVKIVQAKGEENGQLKCMVFDDTVLSKTGKAIEQISRVWDHVSQKAVLGFKLLVMGYWDGTSIIPVDFSLHRELGRNKEKPYGLKKREIRKQFKKRRAKGSAGLERVQESDMTKIESAIKMFWRAVRQGFKIDYVLMDSWFTCGAFINAVRRVKNQTVHLIGMYKIATTKFLYCDKHYTYSQLRNVIRKEKRCRKLRLYYKEAVVCYGNHTIKLFFSKQGKNGRWKTIVCTDTSLSFSKMIEVYQIRWTIEVFFQESKQLLGLGKCQSNDFDAQIADITITMIQHVLLSLRYRFDTYETKGKLFEQIKEEIVELRLNERLWGLFIELLRALEETFIEYDEQTILKNIFQNEKAFARISGLMNLEQLQGAA